MRQAQASGRFDDEIVPVPIKVKKEIVEFKKDEFPRATSMEALSKLAPAFKKDGRVTAGNAPHQRRAAAIVLASGDAVMKYNLKPLAKLVSWARAASTRRSWAQAPSPRRETRSRRPA
jgi:acetyl-CoA C-acetyltransferase